MRKRLLESNPNALRDMLTTFLEANGRGYWETSEENLDLLRELYEDVVSSTELALATSHSLPLGPFDQVWLYMCVCCLLVKNRRIALRVLLKSSHCLLIVAVTSSCSSDGIGGGDHMIL